MRRPSPLPPPSDARPEESGADAASRAVDPPRTVGPPRRPLPEVQPDAPDSPQQGADRASAADGSPDEAETVPLAPVIPFHLRDDEPAGVTSAADPGPLTRPAPPPVDTPSARGPVDPSSESADDEVRFGDVMRAARARRRALRAEVRRFTARQRRRRMAWIGVATAVLVLVLGTLGAAYSPLFAVQTITVEGTERLDAGAVEEALSGQVGTPMPLVDDSEVKAVLVGFPLVETYSLEARPPHELVVRIVERTPIGVLSSPAGFTLVDAAGVGLSTTSTPPAGEPLIEVAGGVESDAFEAVGHVVRSLPGGIRPQVTQVAATTPNDVTLTLGATGTEIVWGGADESAMKALALETIMRSRPPETVAAYDVSSPDAIVLR
ncbi:FtsQ-type POTRA domain-containing protein [Microbacterium jiangjiandongii]|uniref:FtsQ-type POTRA domain-containing protein n=1 Tax=Microbacterium jiangjiandongii TaxID=3049071 RepID=UPI00214BBAA0|nr:FtsQ-type POTRA domain-containing protein [Microbacterium sp. zg.Y843]MCR2816953.1 FtsQ-type POTRA domain-containing protein [Microbacterium sp. zg.Y843]